MASACRENIHCFVCGRRSARERVPSGATRRSVSSAGFCRESTTTAALLATGTPSHTRGHSPSTQNCAWAQDRNRQHGQDAQHDPQSRSTRGHAPQAMRAGLAAELPAANHTSPRLRACGPDTRPQRVVREQRRLPKKQAAHHRPRTVCLTTLSPLACEKIAAACNRLLPRTLTATSARSSCSSDAGPHATGWACAKRVATTPPLSAETAANKKITRGKHTDKKKPH